MTKTQIEKLAKWWQDVLRLRDKDVNIETCSGGEINFEGTLAQVARRNDGLAITIRIAEGQTDAEIEVSIVHELLHVTLDAVRIPMGEATTQLPPQAEKIVDRLILKAEENFVALMSTVLMRLKYDEGGKLS